MRSGDDTRFNDYLIFMTTIFILCSTALVVDICMIDANILERAQFAHTADWVYMLYQSSYLHSRLQKRNLIRRLERNEGRKIQTFRNGINDMFEAKVMRCNHKSDWSRAWAEATITG